MQQATVNLLADMGVQPATLQGGLVPAVASTDTLHPHQRSRRLRRKHSKSRLFSNYFGYRGGLRWWRGWSS